MVQCEFDTTSGLDFLGSRTLMTESMTNFVYIMVKRRSLIPACPTFGATEFTLGKKCTLFQVF